MKCPACQKEMRKGYFIDREAPIQWIPENSKPSIWKAGVADGAVAVGGGSYWKNYKADAYYCSFCRFVVVPVE